MRWIKRNIGLLISILIALLLTAGAVVYLLAQVKANKDRGTELEEQKGEWTRIYGQTYFPNDENIALAQSETRRISVIATNVQRLYVAPPPPKLDDLQFASLMLTTISDLQTHAQTNGVILPARYAFTFDALRDQVRFQSNSIPLLAVQMREIQELCGILFSNRIHSLVELKRVPVSTNDSTSGTHYINKTIVSNAFFTITPYEVVFRGFVNELQSVLNDLQRAPTYFVVKTVDVLPVTVKRADSPPPPPPPANTAAKGSAKGAAPVAPPAQTIRVLDEQPLQVRLRVEVVKSSKPPPK